MADGRNPWLTWALPVVVIGVLLVSNWAWRQKPATTLVARTFARTSAVLSADRPTRYPSWRMVIELPDDLKPPGPEWMLHEGPQPGLGYELHWLPARLSLQVWRSGERLLLLGSATLPRAPRQVEFARQGLLLSVAVDGVRCLTCLDLQPPPEPEYCGFSAAADVGGASLSLYDERRFLPPAHLEAMRGDAPRLHRLYENPELGDSSLHAIARVRYAVLLGERPGPDAEAARRDAHVALRALADGDPVRASLLAWMSWLDVRSALVRGDDAGALAAARSLGDATALRTASELPGLLVDLLGRFGDRVASRPTRPVPPHEVFIARRHRLAAIVSLGSTALDCDSGEPGTHFAPSENLGWHLRLAVHGAGSLIGVEPQPTPAEGPVWVADRWRAFAGLPVKVRAFADEPSGWRERDPLATVVGQLVGLASFDPLPAVGLRAAIDDLVARNDGVTAIQRLDEAPPEIQREAALTRGILATRGIGDVAVARAALAHPVAEGVPLTAEDPLAFAIDRLLQLGLRQRDTPSGILPGVPKLPPTLSWAGPILSGQPGAPAEVWRVLPERPMEGLAAALLMQEIAGETPDWSLLAQAPAFTVPLRLLMPLTKPVTPTNPVVPDVPVTPVVVP